MQPSPSVAYGAHLLFGNTWGQALRDFGLEPLPV